MTLRRQAIVGLCLVLVGYIAFLAVREARRPKLSWMDRMVARMDQGANRTITFEGVIVDEIGRPIPGASVEVFIRGINTKWASDPQGVNARGWDRERSLQSGQDGSFSLLIEGTHFSIMSIKAPGFQWLYEEYGSVQAGSNASYQIAPAGSHYISQQGSPAIFVMVRDGVKDVHVMPSRGGAEVDDKGRITPNTPRWPRKPSLPDVVYKPPPTQPATTPS
mgnify:CR=1 FL=1